MKNLKSERMCDVGNADVSDRLEFAPFSKFKSNYEETYLIEIKCFTLTSFFQQTFNFNWDTIHLR